MFENEQLVDGHRDPNTTRRWESAGDMYWDRCIVIAGELDDGRWYVQRYNHPTIGPTRTEIYDGKDVALEVAVAVMDHASEALGRPFAHIDRG